MRMVPSTINFKRVEIVATVSAHRSCPLIDYEPEVLVMLDTEDSPTF